MYWRDNAGQVVVHSVCVLTVGKRAVVEISMFFHLTQELKAILLIEPDCGLIGIYRDETAAGLVLCHHPFFDEI